MTIRILLAVAGLLLLAVAADHLVVGASRLAPRLRISPVVVGVVVIGLGTSAPELLVSAVAAARGDAGIALGNITGSNILNLTMVLGVAALVAKVTVRSTVIHREVPLAVTAVLLFGLLAWTGLTVVTGAVLVLAVAGALWLLVRWAGEGRNTALAREIIDYADGDDVTGADPATVAASREAAQRQRPAWFEPVRTVLGLAGVLAGAQLLVVNAATIATDLGVPQLVVGITLVAVGTSLPELVTTIQAQRRGESDLLVGNLFGSNLFNSLVGGAVIAFAAPASVPRANVALVVVMGLTALAAWALLRRSNSLTRPEGSVLLAAYVLTMPLLLAA
ncbi:calcium/sodium antiporter [Micromonospora sp. WMMA1363]|uniref:calcium/sodium antiporter n=1 Tax=Micromonospora sp. WMMA1363 TaxID=3053985 RepID=UPI00259D198E|nr:calcium/sodium antiporter [Micromonospora sp. WMMA1363]MDM4718741.1 calcium/sodium antiporter [Micromonospora sp. WMMA1363]